MACDRDRKDIDNVVSMESLGGNWSLIVADSLTGDRLRGLSQNVDLGEEWTFSEDVIKEYINAQDTQWVSGDTLYLNDLTHWILLSPYLDNTDEQSLSFDGSNISITGGNSIDVSSLSAGGGGSFNSFFFNNGSIVTEIGDQDTLTHVASGGSGVSTSGSVSTTVQDMIDSFGIAAVYTNTGVITRANTTGASSLHQYYIGYNSSTITYYGAQTLEVTALFGYTVGSTYYLNDAGRLATTSDATYDSAVLYVIANPSGNNYIINLADPRHFIN